VVVDREEIRTLGVGLHEADLISHADSSQEVRHDALRLAREVREVALVRL
jgi:hypothetical protein